MTPIEVIAWSHFRRRPDRYQAECVRDDRQPFEADIGWEWLTDDERRQRRWGPTMSAINSFYAAAYRTPGRAGTFRIQ